MLAKFVPSDAQNKLEFDLMQCDNINQYFAHLNDDNTKLVPDAFVIGGLTSKPFGFKVKDTNGNKTDVFEKVRLVLDQLPFSLKNNRNNYVQIRYHLANHHSSEFDSEVDLHEFMLDDDVKDYVRINFEVAPWVIVNLYNADRKNLTVDIASFLEARDACQGVYDALYADYCQLREAVTNSFMGPDLDLSNLSLDGNNNEINDADEGAVGENEQDPDADYDSLAKNEKDSDADDKSNLDPDSKQNTNNNDDSDDEQDSDNSVDGSDSSENESDSETEPDSDADHDSLAKNEEDSDADDNSNLDPDNKQDTNSNDDNSDDEQDSDNSVDGSDSGENESDSETEQGFDAGDEPIDKAANIDDLTDDQSESKDSGTNDPESGKVEAESNSSDDENSNSESESNSIVSGDTLSKPSGSETDDMPHVGTTDETTDQNNNSLADDGQSASSENQSTTSESSSTSTGESSVQSSQPKDPVPTVPVLRDITNEGNNDERELYRTLITALKRIDDKKTQPARSKEQEDFYRKLVERLDKVGDVHNSSNVQLETRLQEKLLSAIDRFLATTEEQREKDRLAREAAERQAKEEALLKKEEESAKKEAGKTERQKFTDDQDKMIANLLNENLSAE